MSQDHPLQIYIDGGSRGNPGPAAYAFVVIQNSKIVYRESNFIGIFSNNVAEYHGLICALTYISKTDVSSIQVHMDSLLVVQQINGSYKIKAPHLKILYTKAIELLALLDKLGKKISLQHIYREQNELPDVLLNQTLDQHEKTK